MKKECEYALLQCSMGAVFRLSRWAEGRSHSLPGTAIPINGSQQMRVRIPAADDARVLRSTCPLGRRGRRECRVKASPMARLQKKMQAAGTTGSADQPAFPARWFSRLYVISSGTGLFAPVARVLNEEHSEAWHQHRDARTTRLHVRIMLFVGVIRSRCNTVRPLRPRPAHRDDRAYAPLVEAGCRHHP
jgi:hypothetical protein